MTPFKKFLLVIKVACMLIYVDAKSSISVIGSKVYFLMVGSFNAVIKMRTRLHLTNRFDF